MALRRIKRSRRGFDVRLPAREREILRTLPQQLRDLLDDGDREDPAVKRLFPSAYIEDDAASTEFDDIVRDDLAEQRRRALDEMVRTLDSPSVTEDELLAWLGVVNDLRLVLGVRLAVTEETTPSDFSADDEASGSYALYAYLSYLEEEMVEALASG